jgi:hypothetical protein
MRDHRLYPQVELQLYRYLYPKAGAQIQWTEIF